MLVVDFGSSLSQVFDSLDFSCRSFEFGFGNIFEVYVVFVYVFLMLVYMRCVGCDDFGFCGFWDFNNERIF